jgi:Uma2 family endonuclease
MSLATTVQIPLKTLSLSPGSHVVIPDMTWEQYEALLQELGDDRHLPRITYSSGTLELMSPLLAHERPHRLIAAIVTTLLEHQQRDWEDFGSITFQKPKQVGLEPDTCFYIQNATQVRALMRVNLTEDPPPDLAIESDVTSKTTLEAYALLQIPELWIYDRGKLHIWLLQGDDYQASQQSLVFPDFPIVSLIPNCVNRAFEVGTRLMLQELRQQLQLPGSSQ